MIPPEAPTRVRHGVIAFAVTLAVITYIDRICIMKAAPFIQGEFKLTDVQMGWVFSAFVWTYGLFEIPWGWLGDRIGARKVLMRIVVFWSFFTAATGWAWNYVSLLATRALFGAGEAGCFPNITKAFTTWLPGAERVRAQGILWLSARWGGALTPLLVVWVLTFMTWRQSFFLFGAVGVVWAFFFYGWYRDNPREHPRINAAERALLPKEERAAGEPVRVPWGKILTSRRVWLLCLQYFFLAYAAYFFLSWLPSYIKRARGLEGTLAAVLDGTPLFCMGLGSLFCGFLLAQLARWVGATDRARRLMAILGFGGSAIFLLLAIQTRHPVLAILLMGCAGFANDLVMPPSWAAAMDLGGRYAGTLSATMNMIGCAGAGAFPVAAGYILKWTGGNWDVVLYVSAAAYAAGMLCWLFLDPVTPLDHELKEAPA